MTQAQILQAQIMSDFFEKLSWALYSDQEIMKMYRIAVDTQDGKNIKALRNEMSRRNREI